MDIGTLYRLYFRDVVLFLQGLTHSETLAEELTQETFFKALDGLKSFDGKQDVRAWLFTVARNCYYSYCRKIIGQSRWKSPCRKRFPLHPTSKSCFLMKTPLSPFTSAFTGWKNPTKRYSVSAYSVNSRLKNRHHLRAHIQLGLRDLLPRQTEDTKMLREAEA